MFGLFDGGAHQPIGEPFHRGSGLPTTDDFDSEGSVGRAKAHRCGGDLTNGTGP